jgi:hypothetical protein
MLIEFRSDHPGSELILADSRVVGQITRLPKSGFSVTWNDAGREPAVVEKEGVARTYAYGVLTGRSIGRTTEVTDTQAQRVDTTEQKLRAAPISNKARIKADAAARKKTKGAQAAVDAVAASLEAHAAPLRYQDLKGQPVVDGGRLTCGCGAVFEQDPAKPPADQKKAVLNAYQTGWRWPKGRLTCPACRAK